MSPARRGGIWWGLGTIVVLGVLVVLYFSGVLPLGQGKPEKKALCWVSPKNPNYIKEVARQRPGGQRTGAGLSHRPRGQTQRPRRGDFGRPDSHC